MPTTAPRKEGERVIPPQGTFPARVYKFMNLGTRIQLYQGKPKDYPDTLINISWELPTELNKFTVKKEDGSEEEVEKPFVVSREFTLSMGKKSNLRPIVEGILGTQLSDDEAYTFDLEQLVGMDCQVTIMHKKSSDGDKTYANVVSVAPLMKGYPMPAPINEKVIFDVKTATPEEIDALPDFLKKKVYESDEWKDRFDKETLERRAKIQEDIDRLRSGQPSSEHDINPEDIPF